MPVADAIREFESQCVHCGLCLDACPTYRLSGLEAESPRGRLYLMAAAEGDERAWSREAARHLDSCLGCLACETACPSGVAYGRKIEAFRPKVAATLPVATRWLARLTVALARSRALLRAGNTVAAALDRVGLAKARRRIPGLGLLPGAGRARAAPANSTTQPSAPRLRAVVFPGCTILELRPSIARDAAEALHRNGIATAAVDDRLCCGALSLHTGDILEAKRLARATALALARSNADRIAVCTAGCGAMLRHYDEFLAEGDAADAGRWVSEKTGDVSEVLVDAGFRRPSVTQGGGTPIAYHDACHLLHAAGVSAAPREILEAAGDAVLDLGENGVCCGSAGSYGLLHADEAVRLGGRKAELASQRGVARVAVGNIGCILQIQRALALAGNADVTVFHPIEHLADAYRRETPRR